MEPLNDNELNRLLKSWQAPAAPPDLERRIFGGHSPWRWLMTGSIRVPIPVFALLLVAIALAWMLPRTRAPQIASPPELKLSDFQPVAEMKPRIVGRSQ